jgi:hypothetical protein
MYILQFVVRIAHGWLYSSQQRVTGMTMNLNRAGEAGGVPSRRNRFFVVNGDWYFKTREGAPMGPFDDRGEAEQGLYDFIEFMTLAEPKTLSRLYAALAR